MDVAGLDVEVQRQQVNDMLTTIGQKLDKRYRLFTKLGVFSREITWESKRAISQVLGHFQNPKAMDYAEKTIKYITKSDKCFVGLASSLRNEDKYQLSRYYSAGLQEFVEALALWTFFKDGTILTYEQVLAKLVVTIKVPMPAKPELETDGERAEPLTQYEEIEFAIYMSRRDYFLGLLDITGELVRACAAIVYAKECQMFLLKSLNYVRALFQCVSLLDPMGNDLWNKFNATKNAIIKLETAYFDSVIGRPLTTIFFSKGSYQFKPDDDGNEQEDSGYD